MIKLPAEGAVAGVDVGYSPTRRSSAVCRLWWTADLIGWEVDRFRNVDEDRRLAFSKVVGSQSLLAVAFDGPLRRGLDDIGRYREAERALTVRELRSQIGKPGQSSSPNGRCLNKAANLCARAMLDVCQVAPAVHPEAIHDLAIVEAFPTSFLGLLIEQPSAVKCRPPARSDAYYTYLAASGGLNRLVSRILPGRRPSQTFDSVTNHDDRAALVCALTALCIAAKDYLAVGDEDGWIILPEQSLIGAWAQDFLPRHRLAAVN